MSNCRNCEQSITASIKFCPNCGQKNTDGKVGVWSFLTVFVNQVFNIESKLFKTIRDLFIPGKLTIEYFKGKHKTYFHPLRFFIVLAVLLFALMVLFLNENDPNENNLITPNSRSVDNFNLYKTGYYTILFHQLDSLNKAHFQTQEYDSIAYTQINDLICNALGKFENDNDSLTFKIITGKLFTMKMIDALELTSEEIVDKYEIKGFMNKWSFKQHLKIYKGAQGFHDFFFSLALWSILIMMPILALILMLFYFKHSYYYVEHLVFSFHIYSFIFLLLAFAILIQKALNIEPIFNVLIFPILVYILFAIKKVYAQSWLITSLKFAGISFFYAILSAVFWSLTFFLGLMFF